MATTAALASVTKHCLRYLITSSGDGATLTLTASGAVTPDLVTDTATVLGSPIAKLARAGTVGIGSLAAAAITQAIARTLFMNDGTIAGNTLAQLPCAKTTLHVATGAAAALQFVCDADQAAGLPIFTIIPTAVAGTAYLDIQTRQPIWF